MGESADKHKRHMQELDSNHARMRDLEVLVKNERTRRDEQQMGVSTHLEKLSKLIEDTGEKHAKVATALDLEHKKLRAGLEAHNVTLESRLEFIEKFVGESCSKLDKHASDIETVNHKLKDFQGYYSGERVVRDKNHSLLSERIDMLDKTSRDSLDSLSETVRGLDIEQRKIHASLNELHGRVKGEVETRLQATSLAKDARYSDITERLEHVEQTTHDTSQWRQKHTKEFEFTQAEWKDMKGLLAAEKEGRERLKSIFEDRLDGVRKQMMQDSSGSREVVSIGSMNEDLPDRIDEMRTQLQSEKEKRDKHYEGLCKRLFCVERNGGLLDAALHKECDDRIQDVQRLWGAIDGHTHDLSTRLANRADTEVSGSSNAGVEIHTVRESSPTSYKIIPATTTTTVVPQASSRTTPTKTIFTPMARVASAPRLQRITPAQRTSRQASPPPQVVVTPGMSRGGSVSVPSAPHVGQPRSAMLNDHVETVTCGRTRYSSGELLESEVSSDR